MTTHWRRLAPYLLGAAALPWPHVVRAAEDWLVMSATSYHLATTEHYNQRNLGIGWEHATGYDRLALIGGVYDNSFHRRSAYAGVAWTPLALGPLHLGVAAGGVTNYRPYLVQPLVLPVAQLELKGWGANLGYAPKLKDGVAVLGLQLKWRF